MEKEVISILFKTQDPNEELWFEHFESTLCAECPEFSVISHEVANDNQVIIAKAINSSRRVCLFDTPSLQPALSDCRDWLPGYLCDNICVISVCDDDSDTLQSMVDEEFKHHGWKFFSLCADGEANLKTYEAVKTFLQENVPPRTAKHKPKAQPRRDKKNSISNTPLPSAVDGKIDCVCPVTIYRDGSEKQVMIVFKKPMSADIRIEIADVPDEVKFTKRNPYVVEFIAPDRESGKALIKVYEAGKLLPDKWSLRYLDPNLAPFQCLSSLMNSFGIQDNDIHLLDKKLANIFIESNPRDHLLQRFYDNNNCPTDPVSKYQFPTLLHFAAYHGLEELVATFINSPLGRQACNIKNRQGHDPAEMAEFNGKADIAEYIRDEMDVAEVMTDYVIYINSKRGGDEPYDDLGKYSTAHSINDGKGYVKMLSPDNGLEGYVTVKATDAPGTPGYMIMKTQVSDQPSQATVKRTQSDSSANHTTVAETRSAATIPPGRTPSEFFGMRGADKDIPVHQPVMGSQAQGELEEIREFAQNKDYSTDEVIQLFNLWNQHHGSGSPSFKQRQEALAEMRRDMKKKEAEQKAKKNRFKSIFGKKNEKQPAFEISDPIHYRATEIKSTEDRDSWESLASSGSSDRSSRGSKTDSSDCSVEEWPKERAPRPPPRSTSGSDLYSKLNKTAWKKMPPPPPKSISHRGPPIPPRKGE